MNPAYTHNMGKGMIDSDQGMKKIREELARLGKIYAKVGFPDNGDENNGVRIAQYAEWNENGVTSTKNAPNNGKLWKLPPRPFMAQAFDNNKAKLEQAGAAIVRKVADGKIDASAAARQYAEAMIGFIKDAIKNGSFKENSDITINGIMGKDGKWFIRPKKRSKPLINSGAMRDAVMYQIVEDGSVTAEGGKKPG
jgi:hypothetical protein